MYYIYTVGLSLSGKSWLVNKIKESGMREFVVIDTRSIHDFLNTMNPFKDDNTLQGKSLDIRLEFTSEIRNLLISMFAKKGIDIIQDSGNQIKKERMERVEEVRKIVPEVKTILIYVNPDRTIVEKRALQQDEKNLKNGEKPAWHDLYKMQIEKIEQPTHDEADYYIEYDGSNWESAIEGLKKIMHP